MTRLSRTVSRALLAIATVGILTACSDDPVAPNNAGRIRAVNALSDLPSLDVLINTATYKTGLAYKTTDGYRTTSAGTPTVRFRKSGLATDLATAAATVATGVDYSVVSVGTEAAAQSFVLTDNNTAPAAGKVKLRAVHAANATAAMDVYILANADELATATPVKAALAAKAASDYFERDAGTYVVIFTEAGTKTPLLTISNVQLAVGKIQTLFAVQKTGGGAPLESIALADN